MNKNKTQSEITPVFCENCHHYQPLWVANKEDKKGFNAIPEKCLSPKNKLEKEESLVNSESSHRLPPKKIKKKKKRILFDKSPMELNKKNHCPFYKKGLNTKKRALIKNIFIVVGLIAVLFTSLWLGNANS